MATLSLGAVAGSNNTEPSQAWTLLSSSTLQNTHAYYSANHRVEWVSDEGGQFAVSTAWCWPGAGNLLWRNSNPKTNDTWSADSTQSVSSTNNGYWYDSVANKWWHFRTKSPYVDAAKLRFPEPNQAADYALGQWLSMDWHRQNGRILFAGGTCDGYTVTTWGVKYSTDNGDNWTFNSTVNNGVSFNLIKGIAGDGGNNLLVIGNNGKFWVSTDNGNNWNGGTFPNASSMLGVSCGYANGAWLLIYNGYHYRTTNLSHTTANWTEYTSPTGFSECARPRQGDVPSAMQRPAYSLFHDGSKWVAGGHSAYFYYSTDNGITWTAFPTSLKTAIGTAYCTIAYSPTLNYYLAVETYDGYVAPQYTQYVAKKTAWTNDLTI